MIVVDREEVIDIIEDCCDPCSTLACAKRNLIGRILELEAYHIVPINTQDD